jgi:hypothetical protein
MQISNPAIMDFLRHNLTSYDVTYPPKKKKIIYLPYGGWKKPEG